MPATDKKTDYALFHGDIVSTKRTIYTPTSFAKSSLLYLQEIGTLKANREHTSRRSGLESFLFFFINEGSGELVYEGEKYDLKKGDCVFLYCADTYSHTTSPDLWNISWIHFNGPEMLKIYDKYKQRGGQPVFHPEEIKKYSDRNSRILRQKNIAGEGIVENRQNEPGKSKVNTSENGRTTPEENERIEITGSETGLEIIKRIWSDTYAIANSSDYLRDMRINQYLSELIAEIMVYSWNENNEKGKKVRIREVKQFIDENYAKKIALTDLSERFYINKYYLLRLFKGQYGMTVNEYVEGVRISKAKELLRFTDKGIREIGILCGFEDSHYFSRVFTKVEGISPSEYREKW